MLKCFQKKECKIGNSFVQLKRELSQQKNPEKPELSQQDNPEKRELSQQKSPEKLRYAIIPQNYFRFIAGKDISAWKEYFNQVKKVNPQSPDANIQEFKAARKAFKKKMDSWTVSNCDLTLAYFRLVDSVNVCKEDPTLKDAFKDVSSKLICLQCKSGKDRTQAIRLLVDAQRIFYANPNNRGRDFNQIARTKGGGDALRIIKKLANNGSYQFVSNIKAPGVIAMRNEIKQIPIFSQSIFSKQRSELLTILTTGENSSYEPSKSLSLKGTFFSEKQVSGNIKSLDQDLKNSKKEDLKMDSEVGSKSFAHVDNQSAVIGDGGRQPSIKGDGDGDSNDDSEGGPHTI